MELPDLFFFIGLPYLALIIFVVGTIYRYREKSFKVSALSSQFLEGKDLFWGSVPFHWGILVCFLGHLTALALPQATLMWNSNPVRLIALEVTGFAFGLSAFVGLVALMVRRMTHPRIKMVTNTMDLVIEGMLLVQIILGLWTALAHRWGSSWFAADLSPYLISLLTFSPDIKAVSAMPIVIKLHIILAYLIVAIFPFTRLVHMLVAPFHYIARPYQRVIWYWNRRGIRSTATPWSQTRPKNN